jgi:hypothetical protein
MMLAIQIMRKVGLRNANQVDVVVMTRAERCLRSSFISNIRDVLQKSDLGRKVNKHKPRSGKINRGMKKTDEDPQDVPPNL